MPLFQHYVDVVIDEYSDDNGPRFSGTDFTAFYGGVGLLFSGEPSKAYDSHTQEQTILKAKGLRLDDEGWAAWSHYFNPPFYSLLFAPLLLFDIPTAYTIAIGANVALVGALVFVTGSILAWRRQTTFLFALATLFYLPTYYAIWHAQPTLLLACLFGLAFLAKERGHSRLAGVLLALCAIKPQWLVFPGVLLGKDNRRLLITTAIVGAILGSAFLITGPRGVIDYMSLLFFRGTGDVEDAGYASATLSWSGFLRAWLGHTSTTGWLALSAATLAAFTALWRYGRPDVLPIAGAITTLLVVPHSHPQDWIMLVPAGAFLMRRPGPTHVATVTTALLVALFVATNSWVGLERGDVPTIYWSTVLAFGLLVWLAGLELVRVRAARRQVSPSAMAANEAVA